MNVMKQQRPKQYAIVTKRQALFEKHRHNLDAQAEKFLCDVSKHSRVVNGNLIYCILVTHIDNSSYMMYN